MLSRHFARFAARRAFRLRSPPPRPGARPLHIANGVAEHLPAPLRPQCIRGPWGHSQARSFIPSLGGVEKTLSERRVLPFSPQQLFDVVADVQHYHEFVPFCVSSTVLKRLSDTSMEAQLSIGFRVFAESYVSRVTMEPCKFVRAEAVGSGIFDRLISEWRFREGPTPNQVDVEFMVDFKVSNVLHGAAVDAFFEDVSRLQISAFERRCADKYGATQAQPPLPRRQRRRAAAAGANGTAAAASNGAAAAGGAEGAKLGAVPGVGSAAAIASEAHASPDGHLPLSSFEAAWREASGALGKSLTPTIESPLVAAVVFGAFDVNEDGMLNAKEFVQGVHLITRTGVEEQARLVYLQMDRDCDGLLMAGEVEAKLSHQLDAVRRVMPEVLKRGRMMRGGGGELDIGAELDLVLACETLDILMEQASQEVRAFVKELFRGDRECGVTREEWAAAVRRRPEVLNVLTIYGMAQMVQWAFATQDSGDFN